MGCIQSVKKFVVNPDMQGQDEAAQEVFDTLNLSPHDVDLLYTAFWDIDADSSGSIRPIELFAYFEMESTPFEKGVFSLFDEDKSGLINFMEFVCCLWNLLTLPEPDLGSIAYLLRDPSGTSALRFSDVRAILEIMHKKNVDHDPSLLTIFLKLKKDYNGLLTMAEFCRWTYTNPSVTTPLMMLQLHLRLHIIGESFWVRMAAERKLHEEQGRLDFVKKLQATVVSKNIAYKNRLASIESEIQQNIRRGRGKNGDCRDNVARKESVLLGYFRMKQRSIRRRLSTQQMNIRRRFSTTRVKPEVVYAVYEYDDDGNEVAPKVVKPTTANTSETTANSTKDSTASSPQAQARPRRSFLVKPKIVRPEERKPRAKKNRSGQPEMQNPNTAAAATSSGNSSSKKKKPLPPTVITM